MENKGGAPSHPASPESYRPRQCHSDSAEEQVMSEIHLGCPPHHSGPHISRFTVSLPSSNSSSTRAERCEVDDDGDLILTRRRRRKRKVKGFAGSQDDSFVISIQHNVTSSIPKVGLQVWRAELVLADFVLHTMNKSSNFDGITAVELGAGTGLVGMLLARSANTIFITDKGDDVLANCTENIHLNAGIVHHKASVCVRELDWNCSWPPEVNVNYPLKQSCYSWSASDVAKVQTASLLFAADVIYDDNLTDAFFSVLESIMHPDLHKVLYLALEKRYNFTMEDLDVVANGYSHFCSYFQDEGDDPETDRGCSFVGRLINLEEIPQYVKEYDRGNDVELWQIRYTMPSP